MLKLMWTGRKLPLFVLAGVNEMGEPETESSLILAP